MIKIKYLIILNRKIFIFNALGDFKVLHLFNPLKVEQMKDFISFLSINGEFQDQINLHNQKITSLHIYQYQGEEGNEAGYWLISNKNLINRAHAPQIKLINNLLFGLGIMNLTNF